MDPTPRSALICIRTLGATPDPRCTPWPAGTTNATPPAETTATDRRRSPDRLPTFGMSGIRPKLSQQERSSQRAQPPTESNSLWRC